MASAEMESEEECWSEAWHVHPQTSQAYERSSSKSERTIVNDGMVSRMVLNDNKAGMEGLDKERINAIIHEASKGSKYFDNEKKKEARMEKRIAEQQQVVQSLSADDIRHGEKEADSLLSAYDAGRDLSRSIVHVDMDMFYAAVEMRDHPDLNDKPMAVGGNDMLSTSNYVARRFGVRAAMPGFIGKKLCPELVIVSPNFHKYTAVSKQIREVLTDYDPDFSPMSLDEAYLDFTQHLLNRKQINAASRTFPQVGDWKRECCCSLAVQQSSAVDTQKTDAMIQSEIESAQSSEVLENLATSYRRSPSKSSAEIIQNSDRKKQEFNDDDDDDDDDAAGVCEDDLICTKCGFKRGVPEHWEEFGFDVEEAVREMRWRIQQRTGLTASAGIAPNTMLAKICSDKNKPNGQYRVEANCSTVQAFIEGLPIRKVSGFGKVSCQLLAAMGVERCGDLYTRRGLLYHLYSPTSFQHFMRVSMGLASTTVHKPDERKSISVERTFREMNKPDELYKKCRELSEALAEDMQTDQIVGKTVAIKIKTVNFEVLTRACTVHDYTDQVDVIFTACKELLRKEIQACSPAKLRLRLMGVRMSNLLGIKQLSKQRQKCIVTMFSKMKNRSHASKPVSMSRENIIQQRHQNTRESCIAADKANKKERNGLWPQNDEQSGHVYVCPVCEETISDCSETFNKHLDSCVYVSPTCQTKANCEPEKSRNVENEEHQVPLPTEPQTTAFTENPANEANADYPKEVQPSTSYSSSCSSPFSKHDERVCGSEDDDPGASMFCPLCKQPFEDLVKLNHHLDQCLSKGAIKRCQEETRQCVAQRKKARRCVNTIDSFFKKKT